MLCFQSVLYCIVLYNDVFTFLYVAVGNKLLLLLLLLRKAQSTRRRCQYGAVGSIKKRSWSNNCSVIAMDPRWKHPFTSIVAGPTGCGKTTFVARLLRNAPSMINPAPKHVTWYYGEWQSAYENLDIPNKDCQRFSIRVNATSWC